VLSALGGAGIAGLAGCAGDAPRPERQTFVLTTATETSAAYAMSQGIAAVVNEHADGVRLDARPSKGTRANVGRLDRGESDIAYLQNWTARRIAAGEDPYGNLSVDLQQLFHLYDLGWFFCTPNEWTSVADIVPGSRISPTPRGSGTAPMLQYALETVHDDYERVSIDYGTQGSAMNEGRLDVGVGVGVNFAVEPGWLTDMKAAVALRALDWPDDTLDRLRENDAMLVTDMDTSAFEADGYAALPNPLPGMTLAYNFVTRGDLPSDPLRELLSTLYEHRDALAEYHGLLDPLGDGSFWLQNAYSGLPFHPTAVSLYERHDLWRDDLPRES
jgi:TRAP transporter TAXI family solute receptor